MIPPNVTHAPCDLDQQKRRHQARRDSLAHAVALRRGQRSLLDRLQRRPARELTAEDAFHGETEDVGHSLFA
jgi:hypothetical protein